MNRLSGFVVVCSVYVAINLGVGVGLALAQSSRGVDLSLIHEWSRAWLLEGTDLFRGLDAVTDYPPNAFVTFVPLALIPQQWLVHIWGAITLALTPLLAYLVARSPRANNW
jgi:hypothetical protein